MPIATSPRPRVLLIGESSGDPIADRAIRNIADVTAIPRGTLEDVAVHIERAVKETGPFVACGATWQFGEKFPSHFNQALLGALAPACKLYVTPGAGYEKTDIKWITSTGAIVANGPIAVGARTADGALMLVLAAFRGLTPHDLSVRSGAWQDPTVRSKSWRTSTIGIIGMGNIGLQLANMCFNLGMKVIYSNRRKNALARTEFGHVGLEELYARSDCLVLTCPLTEETRGLVDKRAFGMMKYGVLLVNVARGPVVVEDDLIEALASGKVARAALDVFTSEPHVHPALRVNPNVTLSPHVAPCPDSMGPDINAEVIHNLVRYLELVGRRVL